MVIDSNKTEKPANDVQSKKKDDEPSLKIDGTGFDRDKLHSAKVTANGVENVGSTEIDDFYTRLRGIYNKVPTPSVNKQKKLAPEIGKKLFNVERSTKKVSKLNTLTTDAKKLFSKYPKKPAEKQKSQTKIEKIKYKRSPFEEVDCKTAHYETPIFDAKLYTGMKWDKYRNYRGIDEDCSDSDDNDPDNKFPTDEDLPDDPNDLEKVFHKYVDQLNALADEMQKNCDPAEPGTKESIRSCKYRLDSQWQWDDPKEAVAGIRKCDCPEKVVIDGDTADLQDIKKVVKELKSNHKVTGVVVKMVQGSHTVDESVDDITKQREHKGPALLTKYALERLVGNISKHPALGSLVCENIPLSSSLQVMLIPAFANLTVLKIVGANLKDEGINKLCLYLWRSKSLVVIDFTDNAITSKGAARLAKLIEKRSFYKVMEPDHMAIERLTLNKNPIGTEGLKILMKVIEGDLFLKAIDLRGCDIESTASEVIDLIGKNFDLHVLDIRDNKVEGAGRIIKRILQNCPLEETFYKWEDEEEIRRYHP